MPEGNDMSKLLLRSIFIIFLAMGLAACGGPGGGTAGAGGDTGGDDEEELPTISMGSFDDAGDFAEDLLEVAVNDGYISSNATTDITAYFVYDDGTGVGEGVITAVTFSSSCITQRNAEVSPVELTGSSAITQYTDIACDESDYITAEVTEATNANAIGLKAYATIYIAPQDAGGIVPASTDLVILDIDGAGSNTSAEISFIVKNDEGNPLNGESVTFTVSDESGGVYVFPITDTSGAGNNDTGEVKTTIYAGSVPTTVNVYATIDSNTDLANQSSNIAISAGLPAQKGFNIVLDRYNPEVADWTNITVDVTVYVTDRHAAALTGKVVTFVAEAGLLDPARCTIELNTETNRGECKTKWISIGNPTVDNTVAILAYTKGQEDFVDIDGDGLFSMPEEFDADADDLPEAYLDENGDGSYTTGEYYVENGIELGYNDTGDGVYNGYYCNHDSCEPESVPRFIDVRASTELVEAPSIANIAITDISSEIVQDDETCILLNADNTSATIDFSVIGSNGQSMPGGTTVTVEALVQGEATLTRGRDLTPIPKTNTSETPLEYRAVVTSNENPEPGYGEFVITVTSGEQKIPTAKTVCIVQQ